MKTFMVLAGMLSLGACGGSMGSSTGGSSSDAKTLDQAASGISTSTATYRASTSGMATPSDCTAAVQHYSAEVKPKLDRIQQMSGRMDGEMSSMGQRAGADIECGAGMMQRELARHLAVACTGPDVGANRAEATRHSQAMQELADHMRMRSDEIEKMVGASGTPGGGMMGGGPGMTDGGWAMPDGGTMPFDHSLPGCPSGTPGTDAGTPTNGGTATGPQ